MSHVCMNTSNSLPVNVTTVSKRSLLTTPEDQPAATVDKITDFLSHDAVNRLQAIYCSFCLLYGKSTIPECLRLKTDLSGRPSFQTTIGDDVVNVECLHTDQLGGGA